MWQRWHFHFPYRTASKNPERNINHIREASRKKTPNDHNMFLIKPSEIHCNQNQLVEVEEVSIHFNSLQFAWRIQKQKKKNPRARSLQPSHKIILGSFTSVSYDEFISLVQSAFNNRLIIDYWANIFGSTGAAAVKMTSPIVSYAIGWCCLAASISIPAHYHKYSRSDFTPNVANPTPVGGARWRRAERAERAERAGFRMGWSLFSTVLLIDQCGDLV